MVGLDTPLNRDVDEPLPVTTLCEVFWHISRIPRDGIMHRKLKGRWIPIARAEFTEMVREAGQGFMALGVEPSSKVALLSETRPEWAVADFAILGTGAVNVPIYPTLLSEQIAYIINDSQPTTIVCSTAEQMKKIDEIRDEIPSVKHVVCFEPVDRADTFTLDKIRELGRVRMKEDPDGFERRSAAVSSDDVATIIYTSGTTGPPKGAILTHENLTQNAVRSLQVLRVRKEDIALSFLPLSHVLERIAHYFMLCAGVEVYYAPSVTTVPRNLMEVRPTVMVSVPRLYEKIYTRVLASASDGGTFKKKLISWAIRVGSRYANRKVRGRRIPLTLSLQRDLADRLVFAKLRKATGGRLRYFISGGAPLAPEIAEFFFAAGVPILEGYGLTETSPVISVSTAEALRFGGVGQPIPGVEVKIAADGEILTRGPCVMTGYYGKPKATADTFEDGWFKTGDIGKIDSEGFLYITDRKKDLIVTAGGKNIAPQPIEGKLKQHPLISEAALVGDRRKFVVALLVPDIERLEELAGRLGVDPSDRGKLLDHESVRKEFQEAVEQVNLRLPRFEQIKKFAVLNAEFSIESGELTPTLKVKRRVVEDKFSQEIEKLYGPL